VATHLLKELTGGAWPAGWYTGRDSPNTRRLVADQGGYEYDSDYYGDDLPFWLQVQKSDGTLAPHLVVPYSLDTNDMRFVQAQGFNTGDHFFTYLRDAFDALYAEGDDGRPAEDDEHRHALPAARQARAHRLAAALPGPHAGARARVGLPPHRHRAPLAAGTPSTPPPPSSGSDMTMLTLAPTQRRLAGRIHALLDGTYEHSPWIAEAAWAQAALRHAGAAEAGAGAGRARGRPRGAAGADARPPRTGRQGDGQQDAHRRVDRTNRARPA
jgi:hypothetical protein